MFQVIQLKTIKKYPFKCCSEEHDSDFDVLKYLTDGDSVFVENYECLDLNSFF